MEAFILFYDKCRLCLDQPGVWNMFERDDLPQDIYFCTGVRVHPSDNLPQKMCSKCSKVIANAKELRVTAMNNNEHLRALFDADDDEIRLRIDECVSTSGSKGDEENYKSSVDEKKKYPDEKPSRQSSSKEQISVRTDLFGTSSTVTSSTKSCAETRSSSKKVKLEDSSMLLECQTCQKTFETSKKLYLHERAHNKSIICPLDTCNRRFATKGDMEKHFRTHTGEKPYSCHICGKSFSQRVTLKSHRESVHSEER